MKEEFVYIDGIPTRVGTFDSIEIGAPYNPNENVCSVRMKKECLPDKFTLTIGKPVEMGKCLDEFFSEGEVFYYDSKKDELIK